MLSKKQIRSIYGNADMDGSNQLRIEPAFQMCLAWLPDVKLKTIRCHGLVSCSLEKILHVILEQYGYEEIKRLGLDMYGGAYAYRYKRGGKTLSTHSWGIAIDIDPINNQLKWRSDKARFANKEYQKVMDIYYEYGWVNQGIEKGFDYMHFEATEVAANF